MIETTGHQTSSFNLLIGVRYCEAQFVLIYGPQNLGLPIVLMILIGLSRYGRLIGQNIPLISSQTNFMVPSFEQKLQVRNQECNAHVNLGLVYRSFGVMKGLERCRRLVGKHISILVRLPVHGTDL